MPRDTAAVADRNRTCSVLDLHTRHSMLRSKYVACSAQLSAESALTVCQYMPMIVNNLS